MSARFVQVDVFTDHAFGGNPLAVFPEGHMVPESLMQRIAREMNLSETTFVLPPDDPADAAFIRIYTPGLELRFAGHPTIGTAYVLAVEGAVARNEFSLQEKVGHIPIHIEGSLSHPDMIWMDQPLPTFGEPFEDRSGVAACLGVAPADLLDIPVRVGSSGTPFLFVGLRTPEGVDRVALTGRDLSLLDPGGVTGAFVFAPLDGEGRSSVYSRMLGFPATGVSEDPATGSASGPLGALLFREGVVGVADTLDILSRQGVAMGRPSEVFIRLEIDGRAVRRVLVGGRVVPVLQGRLEPGLLDRVAG